LTGDFTCRSRVQCEPPKRLPGGLGELRLDQLQKAMKNMVVVLLVPQPAQATLGIDELVQHRPRSRRRPPPPKLAEQVNGDASQPGPERARAAVVLELRHPADQYFQDALGQVITVGGLQPGGMERYVQEGRVKLD